MTITASDQQKTRFFPALLKGYVFGTLASAVALHVAVALIAPVDGGTLLALTSGIIGLIFAITVGAIAMVVFPFAALASWPLRHLANARPILAFVACVCVGTATGALATLADYRVGPGDNWSGSLVGFVSSLVWFFIAKTADWKKTSL